jgi:tetratricopeptide repeat protein 21B
LLKENRSCGKAQELMGLIREKEQAYADASEFYEKAFELTSRKSAAIGYRLAYNYMKAKRYIDCLEVCRQVTEVHPSYTTIKTDIE